MTCYDMATTPRRPLATKHVMCHYLNLNPSRKLSEVELRPLHTKASLSRSLSYPKQDDLWHGRFCSKPQLLVRVDHDRCLQLCEFLLHSVDLVLSQLAAEGWAAKPTCCNMLHSGILAFFPVFLAWLGAQCKQLTTNSST